MGLWPFGNNAEKIGESHLLDGMTDWHSHLLPGVDDGFRSMQDTLEALHFMEKAGVKNIWLTPHIMEDYPNETEFLKERFAELKNEYKGAIHLNLASENMLDSLFEERLQNSDLLPIGEEGRFLLVETSYFNPPMNLEETLESIMSKGFFPLLAHPERYRYMDEEDYKRLKDMGVRFQGNYFSLVGAYGETARKKLDWMLKNAMIDVVGSDIHRLSAMQKVLDSRPGKKKSLDAVKLLKAARVS